MCEWTVCFWLRGYMMCCAIMSDSPYDKVTCVQADSLVSNMASRSLYCRTHLLTSIWLLALSSYLPRPPSPHRLHPPWPTTASIYPTTSRTGCQLTLSYASYISSSPPVCTSACQIALPLPPVVHGKRAAGWVRHVGWTRREVRRTRHGAWGCADMCSF